MDAMDNRNRWIHLVTFPSAPRKQHVSLFSAPPTQHDTALEAALLSFSANDLHCQNSQVSARDNPASAKPFYERELHRIDALFREAKVISNGGT
jgi:hypothetical protein